MPKQNAIRAPRLPSLPKAPLRPEPIRGLPKSPPLSDLPPLPAGWVGSDIEYFVFWWLVKHGYQPNIDFQYQGKVLGGRTQLGGFVPDFVIYGRTPPLIINVQGAHWHTPAEDLMVKIQLINQGYDVVYVREADAHERLDYTMRRAMEGVQLYED